MSPAKSDLPQGTLDLLILTIVASGPQHGYAIAQRLQRISNDMIQVRFTVTGVMPETFHLPVGGITSVGLRADVWMPLDPLERAGAAYVAYARLKPGVSFQAAGRLETDRCRNRRRASAQSNLHRSPVRSS